MKYKLLEDLIAELKQYESEQGTANLSEFSAWLYEQQHREELPGELNGAVQIHKEINENITHNLVELYQHARHYIKTALRASPLKGVFDFAFLATLDEMGDLRKSDLIHYNTVEFSPGMEVIRRLLRNGLIEDYNDPNDGRSKKVRLSVAGRETLQEVRPKMDLVYQVLAGNLGLREKRQTLNGLRKLTNFHHTIWDQLHGEDLNKIARFDILEEKVEQSS